MYVGDAAGKLYAIDAATSGATAKYSLQLSGTSPQITGLHLGGRHGPPAPALHPRAHQREEDSGSALTACSGWSVNLRSPAAGSSPSQPLISDTAIFYPAADGKIYRINPADGTLVGTAGAGRRIDRCR